MATTIPLNFFKRVSTTATTTDRAVYTVPFDRASIIISAYVTNITNVTQTVNVKLSTVNAASSLITIVNALPVLPNDAINVAINKIVLTYQIDNPTPGGDVFIISASNNNAVNLTLSILESDNRK